MSYTEVVNLREERYEVFIGRGSRWGNPFIIGRDGTREQVIALYAEKLLLDPSLRRAAREALRGHILGCYCKPLECHGDLLAYIADLP